MCLVNISLVYWWLLEMLPDEANGTPQLTRCPISSFFPRGGCAPCLETPSSTSLEKSLAQFVAAAVANLSDLSEKKSLCNVRSEPAGPVPGPKERLAHAFTRYMYTSTSL